MKEHSPVYIFPYHEAGIFSNFLTVLAKLKRCEEKDAIPVVFWGQKCRGSAKDNPYFEKKYGENVWDYYFEPVSDYKYCDILTGSYKDDAEYMDSPTCFVYRKGGGLRAAARSYIDKYIKIKDAVQKKTQAYYKANMSGRHVLGVHMRGTDRHMDAHVDCCSPPARLYVRQIDKYLKIRPEAFIFVATDSEVLLDEIRQRYPQKVIFYDAMRSKNNVEAVHWTLEGSPYKKGEDALVDCLLLSKCDFLIRSISNLSVTSLYFNPHLRQLNIAQLYYNNQWEYFIKQTYLDWKDPGHEIFKLPLVIRRREKAKRFMKVNQERNN